MEFLSKHKTEMAIGTAVIAIVALLMVAGMSSVAPPREYETTFATELGMSFSEPVGWDKEYPGENQVRYTKKTSGTVITIQRDDMSDLYEAYRGTGENPSAVLISAIVGEMPTYRAAVKSSVDFSYETEGHAMLKFDYRNTPGVYDTPDGKTTFIDRGEGDIVFLNMKYDEGSIPDGALEKLESLYDRIEVGLR